MAVFKRLAPLVMLVALATGLTTATPAALADEPTASRPLLMVVIGFDGGGEPDRAVPYDDAYDWSNALFGQGESPASFYLAMSDGSFTFAPANETSASGVNGNSNACDRENDGVVHVTLNRPHGAWGAVNVRFSVTQDFGSMVMDALEAASEYIDFGTYDANGDGEITHDELAVCLCVAGYEASSFTDFNREDIPLTWAHSGMLSQVVGDSRSAGGYQFETYVAIAEKYVDENESLDSADQEPLGVLYHELGHAVGLPDLYAVDVTEGAWADFVVGPLSLMDSGGWQYYGEGPEFRNLPTALDAWSRYVLGWTEPTIAAHSGDYLVSSQLSDSGYEALIIPTSDPDEYFLVENRQAEGYDVSLSPGYDDNGGIVVWHVDNNMYERYYDANQVNDADHHPAITTEDPGNLLLYNNDDDHPESREPAGIAVSVASSPSRDMAVHVEISDEAAAHNVVHLINDTAREDLSMRETALLSRISAIVAAAI